MRVLLDDQNCDVNAATVSDAVTAGAALAGDRGRVIVDVFVNGQRWSSAELAASRAGNAAHSDDEVRLVSADPGSLVDYTFSQVAEALTDAGELQREAAELLQGGKQPEALERLGRAIELWLSIQEALTSGSRLVGLDLDAAVISDVPIRTVIQRLDEQLRSLRSALESRDTISLADTLLYELPHVVDEWRAMVEHLQSELKSLPGRAPRTA